MVVVIWSRMVTKVCPINVVFDKVKLVLLNFLITWLCARRRSSKDDRLLKLLLNVSNFSISSRGWQYLQDKNKHGSALYNKFKSRGNCWQISVFYFQLIWARRRAASKARCKAWNGTSVAWHQYSYLPNTKARKFPWIFINSKSLEKNQSQNFHGWIFNNFIERITLATRQRLGLRFSGSSTQIVIRAINFASFSGDFTFYARCIIWQCSTVPAILSQEIIKFPTRLWNYKTSNKESKYKYRPWTPQDFLIHYNNLILDKPLLLVLFGGC